MCGIIGYYCFGDARPDKAEFRRMLIECSTRGTDATGFAYLHGGQLRVVKDGVQVIEFVQGKAFKELEMPKFLTAHTRNGTSGKATDNKNNHPLYSKLGTAITHNGIISNDDAVFKKKKYQRDGQVDSEVILRAVDEKIKTGLKESAENLSILLGSLAVAVISEVYPDKLMLVRYNNPLVICYDKTKDILYYGSTKKIIEAGFGIEFRGLVFPQADNADKYYAELDDEFAMIIGPEGVEELWEFWEYGNSIAETSGYKWRKEEKEEEAKDVSRSSMFQQCNICGEWVDGNHIVRYGRELVCDTCNGASAWPSKYSY